MRTTDTSTRTEYRKLERTIKVGRDQEFKTPKGYDLYAIVEVEFNERKQEKVSETKLGFIVSRERSNGVGVDYFGSSWSAAVKKELVGKPFQLLKTAVGVITCFEDERKRQEKRQASMPRYTLKPIEVPVSVASDVPMPSDKMTVSLAPQQLKILGRILVGMKSQQATLANGKHVETHIDVFRWLLETVEGK